MKQHVFLVHGQRRITEADVTIVVCKKRTWVQLLSGKRRLLGSTAFFTRAAAERCKLALLQKLVATGALNYLAPTAIQHARRQLDLFKDKGVLH